MLFLVVWYSGVQHLLIIWVTWWCLIRGKNCLPFTSTWVHPRFLVGSVLLIFFVFCVVYFFLYSSCVLCAQCCQCLCIVNSLLPLQLYRTFILSEMICELFQYHVHIATGTAPLPKVTETVVDS